MAINGLNNFSGSTSNFNPYSTSLTDGGGGSTLDEQSQAEQSETDAAEAQIMEIKRLAMLKEASMMEDMRKAKLNNMALVEAQRQQQTQAALRGGVSLVA